MLVTRGIASYRDLDEYFSVDDALEMFYMLEVKDYNEWLINEKARKEIEGNKKR